MEWGRHERVYRVYLVQAGNLGHVGDSVGAVLVIVGNYLGLWEGKRLAVRAPPDPVLPATPMVRPPPSPALESGPSSPLQPISLLVCAPV